MRITRLTKADALRLTQRSDALPRAEKALADATLTPSARQVLLDFVAAHRPRSSTKTSAQAKTRTRALDVLLAQKHVDTARVIAWLDDAARDIAAADARVSSLARSSTSSPMPTALRGLKAASFAELQEWLDG